MLEATRLTKRYNGVTALDALDLTVRPGEVFCLLGANGAGKTTTINLFLNFVEPSAGTARINGIDVTEQPLETKKYVAYIPETVMLYRNLTGLENLEYFSALAGRPDYTRADLLEFFKRVGLAGRRRRSARGHLLEGHAPEGRHRDRARQEARRRSCSTSRPRASTRKPPTSSRRCSRS